VTKESALEDATDSKEAGESSSQADGELLGAVIRAFRALLAGSAPVGQQL